MHAVSFDEPQDLLSIGSQQPAAVRTLRRLFPAYCLLAALVTFGFALYDPFQVDGDAIAYMNLSDYVGAHQWHAVVNGYWQPMYPAFLSVAHALTHATLQNEVRAYYLANYVIFLFAMLAVVLLSDAIVELRATRSDSSYVLDCYAVRYLGIALLVFSSQHELRIGAIKPDTLLLVFFLTAITALLRYLATARLRWAAAMGLALGCAYLTKSFGLLFAAACVAVLIFCAVRGRVAAAMRIVAAAAVSCIAFAVVAAPCVFALSKRAGRLDFGDSGALNYAWYVDGTERLHLEPFMRDRFGVADVHLTHPEGVLLQSPLILSYAEVPYGTNPDWFDPAYWNDGVTPRFTIHTQASRLIKNARRLVVFVVDHPESWILVAFLFALGAGLSFRFRRLSDQFWVAPTLLGLFTVAVYGLVNIEERYITFAFICVMLSHFARLRMNSERESAFTRSAAPLLILMVAFVAVAQSCSQVLEDRRQVKIDAIPGGWYSPVLADAAQALEAMGVRPGDHVACIGTSACLGEFYWARLAGVRILTEVYVPSTWPYEALRTMPNREQVIDIVRKQGARVMVADFGTARVVASDPAFRDWKQLGDTTYYALPLNP